jgi:hypothetical protein
MTQHEKLHYIPIVSENALADFDHPDIMRKAEELTRDKFTDRDQFMALHEFVREGIPFGFAPGWDRSKASRVLRDGLGYCNTKTTLLLALCRAIEMPAVAHFALADRAVLEGIFPWWSKMMSPEQVAHSYLEVDIAGTWRRVDSYIVDRALCRGAHKLLRLDNRSMGYGIAPEAGAFEVDSCVDEEGFVQMGAVVHDFGIFEDPIEFIDSPDYPEKQKMDTPFRKWGFLRAIRIANRKLDWVRQVGAR